MGYRQMEACQTHDFQMVYGPGRYIGQACRACEAQRMWIGCDDWDNKSIFKACEHEIYDDVHFGATILLMLETAG